MSWRSRLYPNVSKIVFGLNPKDPNCFGMRNWFQKNVDDLSYLNKGVGLQITEKSVGEPIIYVHYGFNEIREIRAAGATEAEMDDIMEGVVNYAKFLAPTIRGRIEGYYQTNINPNDVGHRTAQTYGPTAEQENLIINFDLPCTSRARYDPYLQTSETPNNSYSWLATQPTDPGQLPRRQPRNASDKLII